MKDTELDTVYTQLCRTMTTLGQDKAQLYLARFALLAIRQIDDQETALRLIRDAAEDLSP